MTISDTLQMGLVVMKRPALVPLVLSFYKPYPNRTISTLAVPDAVLSYTVHGDAPDSTKPILLTISGANGERSIWQPMAAALASDFAVITYDRRGFSASKLTTVPRPDLADAAARVSRDADDAIALIEHVRGTAKDRAVYVVGSSIGGVIALELLRRAPQLATRVIAYEPPHSLALDEQAARDAMAKRWTDLQAQWRAKGIAPAIASFSPQLGDGLEREALKAGMMNPLAERNVNYWFEHELTTYTTQEPRFDEWAAAGKGGRLVLAVGQDSVKADKPLVSIARAIALKTGTQVKEVPGYHLGMVGQPQAFAKAVSSIVLEPAAAAAAA